MTSVPDCIPNHIAGTECAAVDGETTAKINPDTGAPQWRLVRSKAADVDAAVMAARAAQPAWAECTPVARGRLLLGVARALGDQTAAMAAVVAAETGKAPKEAAGETGGAVQQGEFWGAEGMRLYGRSLTSGTPDKYCVTVRQPLGVAGLIVPANTPIANVAWKVFPALLCGNTAVLKAAEDAPATAWLFARLAKEAGLPPGVLNVVHGLGAEAGAALVAHDGIDVISFTGSSTTGRAIAAQAARRLVRVSLELGGKNPLVVADDADIDNAVKWTVLSAFSNAGQRCAASSRIIVFDAVYERFRDALLARTAALKVGNTDDDDFGPVINRRQLDAMTAAVTAAVSRGATVLTGGGRLTGPRHAAGFYMAPTVLDGVDPDDPLSDQELFGPVTVLYRVSGFDAALALANRTPYGLTAAIHTRNVDRALHFAHKVRTGVANVNAGTYGSEPHMPFGGFGLSGNGTREPGTEALDVYSELKNIAVLVDRGRL